MGIVRKPPRVGLGDVVKIVSGKYAGEEGVVTERDPKVGNRFSGTLVKRVKVRISGIHCPSSMGVWISAKSVEVLKYADIRRTK